jgi:hypothetical protein
VEDDIKEMTSSLIKIDVDKADSSEIFKELVWREERSKELISSKLTNLTRNHGMKRKPMNELKQLTKSVLSTILRLFLFSESELKHQTRSGPLWLAHTCAPDFFQGGVKFVDPIFNTQFFSKK